MSKYDRWDCMLLVIWAVSAGISLMSVIFDLWGFIINPCLYLIALMIGCFVGRNFMSKG